MPNLYFILLVIFLMPFSLIMTWQILQLILLESNYFKLCKKKTIDLSIDQLFVFVKILIKKRLWFKSLKLLESLEDVDLSYRHKYFNIFGFIYYKIEQYNLAKKYYLKSLYLKNNYLVALQNLAKVHELQKDYSLALKVYNSILSYDSNNKLANIKVARLKSRDSRI
uniref:Conserved hypothetical plastid protein n=1 Tax=Calliarthron tuberculosum TaxID=48942 RepID=M4ITK1_CALTB|nr:conserved hypothetical plastid protein [Calliarthron tuberculosum]AGA63770.1 conserved hypothetical plastid protein [Calliarthron tuberculosum]